MLEHFVKKDEESDRFYLGKKKTNQNKKSIERWRWWKCTRNCIEKGINMKIEKINKERETATKTAFNKERDNVYAINLVNIK